jgi:hypothetical protein
MHKLASTSLQALACKHGVRVDHQGPRSLPHFLTAGQIFSPYKTFGHLIIRHLKIFCARFFAPAYWKFGPLFLVLPKCRAVAQTQRSLALVHPNLLSVLLPHVCSLCHCFLAVLDSLYAVG